MSQESNMAEEIEDLREENGVAFGCLTIAQLEARVIELEDEVARLKALEEGGKTE